MCIRHSYDSSVSRCLDRKYRFALSSSFLSFDWKTSRLSSRMETRGRRLSSEIQPSSFYILSIEPLFRTNFLSLLVTTFPISSLKLSIDPVRCLEYIYIYIRYDWNKIYYKDENGGLGEGSISTISSREYYPNVMDKRAARCMIRHTRYNTTGSVITRHLNFSSMFARANDTLNSHKGVIGRRPLVAYCVQWKRTYILIRFISVCIILETVKDNGSPETSITPNSFNNRRDPESI